MKCHGLGAYTTAVIFSLRSEAQSQGVGRMHFFWSIPPWHARDLLCVRVSLLMSGFSLIRIEEDLG